MGSGDGDSPHLILTLEGAHCGRRGLGNQTEALRMPGKPSISQDVLRLESLVHHGRGDGGWYQSGVPGILGMDRDRDGGGREGDRRREIG